MRHCYRDDEKGGLRRICAGPAEADPARKEKPVADQIPGAFAFERPDPQPERENNRRTKGESQEKLRTRVDFPMCPDALLALFAS